jgi:hypothetical protein
MPHLGRARLLQFPPRYRLDLDFVFMLPGLRQVVGCLKPQPCFRIPAKRLGEADRHIRRYAALAVHKIVERLPRYAQSFRRLGDRQAKRLDAVMPHGLAGVGWIFHRHAMLLSASG